MATLFVAHSNRHSPILSFASRQESSSSTPSAILEWSLRYATTKVSKWKCRRFHLRTVSPTHPLPVPSSYNQYHLPFRHEIIFKPLSNLRCPSTLCRPSAPLCHPSAPLCRPSAPLCRPSVFPPLPSVPPSPHHRPLLCITDASFPSFIS